MHCKALTTADFDRWTVALRGFLSGPVQESTGRLASMGRPANDPHGPAALDGALDAVAALSHVSRAPCDSSDAPRR